MTTGALSKEDARRARESAAECLALCAHYSEMTRGHLEIGDDSGALWDLTCAVDAIRRAVRSFAPIRARMAAPGRPETGAPE